MRARLRGSSPRQRRRILSGLTDRECLELVYDWPLWARDDQLPPSGDWETWFLCGGRGSGKTRSGAEFVIDEVTSGRSSRPLIAGPTAGDTRDYQIEGISGILACSPPWFRPVYNPSKRIITWPNGAIGTIRSADQPNGMRGGNYDLAWLDEIGSWRYGQEAMDNLDFAVRIGENPRKIITSTPRPIPHVKALIDEASEKGSHVIIVRVNTYANRANLAASFFRKILRRYEGTRLGRQEIYAELLEDHPNALWVYGDIDKHRIRYPKEGKIVLPDMSRIVVGVDPQGKSRGISETGIVAAGKGVDGDFYVLGDWTVDASPAGWGRRVFDAYTDHKADRVVGEVNYGGEMVEAVIRGVEGAKDVPYKDVHATRGKAVRAEPVSSLYEQGRVHHVGVFAKLEDEQTSWDPSDPKARSPNRLDALVWAITELIGGADDLLVAPAGETRKSAFRRN